MCAGALRRVALPPTPAGVSVVHAVFAYDDLGKKLVAGLKFGGARGIVPWFAEALGLELSTSGTAVDLVTWLPASRRQRRRRGFDQAELLARQVGVELDCPVIESLRRIDTGRQTGRSRAQRLAGPVLGPTGVCGDTRICGRSVLLIDDVMTTGASLAAGACALRSLGALDVAAGVVAYSP